MNEYNKYSDSELAALLREGDNTAFLEIYNRYNVLLLNYAFRKLQDKQEAQDVVQEIFISLWEKREGFFLKTYLSGFLYKSVLNKVLNIFKHNKVVRGYQQLKHLNIDVDTVETDFLIREKDIAAMIEKEISAMPLKMRTVYELKNKQYLSTKEIAAELGIAENTVSNHLKAASSRLRQRLGILIFVLYILHQ